MPSLTLPGRLLWFAHCPKAGGTSVERFMVDRWGDAVGHLHWGWDLWWRDGGWRVADPPNSPQHLVWRDALARLPRQPDGVFSVVRDPVARMLSEHRWQRHHRRGTRAGKLLSRLPFSLWLRIMLATVRLNPHAFDNHLRPQADFVPDGAMVFRLEDGLAPVGRWLCHIVGETPVSESFPHLLTTEGGTKTACPGASDLALIVSAFAEDYRRFGYAVPEAADDPETRPVRTLDWLARRLAPAVAAADRRALL